MLTSALPVALLILNLSLASCVVGDRWLPWKWHCFRTTLVSLLMLSLLVLSLQQSCCFSVFFIYLTEQFSLSLPLSHSCFFLSFMFACSLSCSSLSLLLTSSTCSRLDMYSMGGCACHHTHIVKNLSAYLSIVECWVRARCSWLVLSRHPFWSEFKNAKTRDICTGATKIIGRSGAGGHVQELSKWRHLHMVYQIMLYPPSFPVLSSAL